MLDELEYIDPQNRGVNEFLIYLIYNNKNYKENDDLYFGTEIDYDLTKCTEEPVDLGNGYKLYNYTNGSSGTVEAYVICEDGKKNFS